MFTGYSEIVRDVTRDIGRREGNEKEIGSLKTVEELERILFETFDMHCICSLYTQNYH